MKITFGDSPTAVLSGGDLPEDYNVKQIHFHWGSNDNKGSEHTLKSNKYPLEVWFV